VEEFFERLSVGELSNLALSNEGSGTIVEDKRPQIISFTNEGLRKIFGRLPLKEGEVIIKQEDHITDYILHSDYAQTNINAPINRSLYIQDSDAEPFTNDVLRILSVHKECGYEFTLNDKGTCHSLFTPKNDHLQIPNPEEGELLSIIYQAKHERLTAGNLQQEIVMPSALETALQAYVAYKVYSAMNGQEATMKASEHLANYEANILEVIGADSAGLSTIHTPEKFEDRGWV